ncbi:MAG: sigma-70 family RNA polymerase sigma factor [Flavobacteriales bacterium]|nr:sigma-70 family RNA polymerase sigma factor [Flavobacteriales bacterium]
MLTLNSSEYMQTQSRYHKTKDQLLEENSYVEASKTNPAKFEYLYNKYHEQIFRYVYQRMDDKDLAFDVTSQVFMKALTNIHKYQFRGVPFASWLYRIAKSEVYQSFKEGNKSRTVNIETTHVYEIIEELDENENEGLTTQVIELIGELPERDLQLIEMRYFEQRSYKEIGEIMDMTENNAKVRAYRILKKLQKQFRME